MISIIAVIGKNRELGKNNKLLWHISKDLKRFKRLTTGHAVIMGRKTFESMGKPLPNRVNIVVSHNKDWTPLGCIVVNSLEEAIKTAKTTEKEEIFVIGGGQMYKQTIALADRLYLTVVDAEAPADTFFPDYSAFNKILHKENQESDGYHYTFLDLIK